MAASPSSTRIRWTDVPANNESEDTFSDGRIYKGPLPAGGHRSIVEEETTVMDKLPFFSGGGIYRAYFSRSVPVLRSRLIIEAPSDAPLIVKLHSMPDSMVTQDGKADGVRRLTYDLSAVPLALNSDIALATDKPRTGFVEFATGESWSTVAAAYQKLAEPQIQRIGSKRCCRQHRRATRCLQFKLWYRSCTRRSGIPVSSSASPHYARKRQLRY